ncbi:hypothetical protein [Streptomyces scopuliridis]|uniref:hypothetical protein n=1 Tax=Streptomyces scopuliridis TaxID=452529 RepID=UPI00341A3D84
MAADPSHVRREAVCSWLRANDIDPRNVPEETELRVTTEADGQRTIHYTAFVRDQSGNILVDPNDGNEAWRKARTTPCAVESPESLRIPA